MRKKAWIRLLTMLILISATVFGSALSVAASADFLVDDEAGLLKQDEIEEIETQLKKLSKDTGYAFVVVTTDNTYGKSSEAYADDYFDACYPVTDGVLYLIDMDNREVYISTCGGMIRKNSDRDIDRIIDAGYDELRDGKYKDCILQMLKKQRKVLGFKSLEWFEVLLAVLAGIVTALITGGIIIGKYKLKLGGYQYSYAEKGSLKLSGQEDRLTNQMVTHRRVSSSSGSSGGGSSTHTSSSGRTHGGGGRSF